MKGIGIMFSGMRGYVKVDEGELKEAINNFVWRWGKGNLTLTDAEAIAVAIFELLTAAPKYPVGAKLIASDEIRRYFEEELGKTVPFYFVGLQYVEIDGKSYVVLPMSAEDWKKEYPDYPNTPNNNPIE